MRDEAIDCVDRENGFDLSRDPETVYRQCLDMAKIGEMDRAISGLESLTAQHPDFAVGYNDLGVLYYQKGDKTRCMACYAKAVELDSSNPIFRKNLADFYLVEKGAIEESMEIYASLLKENSEDIDALMAAAHISLAIGKKSSAKLFYERVLDIEPWNYDAIEQIEALANA